MKERWEQNPVSASSTATTCSNPTGSSATKTFLRRGNMKRLKEGAMKKVAVIGLFSAAALAALVIGYYKAVRKIWA